MMIEITETANTPPALYAAQRVPARGRKIWDPNPVLSSFNLGEVTAFYWKDKTGYEWEGQVVRPRTMELASAIHLSFRPMASPTDSKP
jgi:hypothetical protein